MIISVLKEEFLEKLYASMGAVTNKNTTPALEGVLIDAREDGTIRMTTYDMIKGVRSFITENVKVIEPGSNVIGAARLLQIVKVLPDHEYITIEVDDNLNVKVKSDNSSFSLFAMRGVDYPSMPELTRERGLAIKSSVLKRMINKTIHSIAVQDNRPQLTGAFFTFDEDRLEIISCDSYTLSKCSVKCEFEDIGEKEAIKGPLKLIIPGHALNEVVRLMDDSDELVKIYTGYRHVIFHTGGVQFFTRLIDGEYFDYERIIPKEQTVFITLNRERFLAGLERAILVADEKYAGSGRSYVKLTVGGEKLVMTSSSPGGKIYDEMAYEHQGDDLVIGFNCRFLINSVRAADSENIVITMRKENTSITIEPLEKSDEKDFFYLVLPLRMNDK